MENDSESLLDPLALIGRAVSLLLQSGETPDAEKILLMLRTISARSHCGNVSETCNKACEMLVSKRLH